MSSSDEVVSAYAAPGEQDVETSLRPRQLG